MIYNLGKVLDKHHRDVVKEALTFFVRLQGEGPHVDRANNILSELEDQSKKIYLLDYPEINVDLSEYVEEIH
jgi:hypothetical protein